MKYNLLTLFAAAFFLLSFSAFDHRDADIVSKFPYRQAGLTTRQAAAHLISRFSYGATPGQVDEVVKEGLENWFMQQLSAKIPDDSLDRVLGQYDAVKLSNAQLVQKYPRPGQILKMAVRDGVVNKDSVKADKKEYRGQLLNYMQHNGLKPEQDLFRQFIDQKILRASYSKNQLQEVMTDFWFNHFNVSITKNQCAVYIPSYERDVIRPNVFGKFDKLLLATAKSPAMLVYLDNFTSTSSDSGKNDAALQIMRVNITDSSMMQKIRKAKKNSGLNENYAREVMELHTMGVDGGYSQQDVTQAARVLTGWTIFPEADGYGGAARKLISRIGEDKLEKRGFVHDGDFLFTPNRHDKGEKVVLGKTFGPDGGYQEGVQLLELLTHHPSTAKFISHKLAVRFVSDNPTQSLVEKMAKTFTNTDGDIKQVLLTMVEAPEFWDASAIREKTKSPFELAIGAVRSLNGQVDQPYQLFTWITRMGEKKYYYQAPTGFPDRGQYWINTGSLLSRMNFGLALAAGRIPGIRIDLLALNNHHEPESAQAALLQYGKLIMPERDMGQTIKRLTPLLNDPQLANKIESANSQSSSKQDSTILAVQPSVTGNNMLAQVVGIIIGSPEFQRR